MSAAMSDALTRVGPICRIHSHRRTAPTATGAAHCQPTFRIRAVEHARAAGERWSLIDQSRTHQGDGLQHQRGTHDAAKQCRFEHRSHAPSDPASRPVTTIDNPRPKAVAMMLARPTPPATASAKGSNSNVSWATGRTATPPETGPTEYQRRSFASAQDLRSTTGRCRRIAR